MNLTSPAKKLIDQRIKELEAGIRNDTDVAADEERFDYRHRQRSMEWAIEKAQELQILKFMRT